MARRCYLSKPYLGHVETGKRPVTETVVTEYARVLGVGLHDDEMNRRDFMTMAAVATANAVLVNDLGASLAGGDVGPLGTVQTSHVVDRAIATVIDKPVLRRLQRWMETEDSDIVRVNAAGILAKAPGQPAADHVAAVLQHDADVQARYLTAVVARVLGIDHATAAEYVSDPYALPAVHLAAQRLAAEAINPNDVGARWCSATMLARLSPLLGR
ncbi:twin-arginine translocation signal domain-containing protein [Nocardia sp. CA-129566]|uniref:twin-arginine translocation signal domain-containing protein n=1 Tax=Nocardia sp. CA-129566 TaxID=3239976 RepID=UPI003D96B3DC